MFEGFANVWTPVMLARKVKQQPVPVTLAGERLVLFRGADGQVAALFDQCPHRGAALSLGNVRDGCLQCPFHGWRFDGHGAVTHVPLSPDAKRERLFASTVPVRQFGELLWVFTAPVKQAPFEPEVPDGLVNPAFTRNYIERLWRCHWTRAMENMLDSPHLPFVHRTTIGRSMARRMTEGSRMTVTWEPMPWGGRQRSMLDGDDSQAHLDFYRPNLMALHIPIPDKVLRMHALVVPVDAETTRLIIVGARSFARARVLNPLFNKTNAIIADQDQAIVESSLPKVVPPPAEELSVATDRATLQFRRYYFDVLAGSSARPPSRSPRVAA